MITVHTPPETEHAMRHLTIVTTDTPGLLALLATCESIHGDIHIAGYGPGSTGFLPGTILRLIGVTSGAVDEATAVLAAIKNSPNHQLITVLKSGEQYPRANHPCYGAVARWVSIGVEIAPDVVFTAPELRDVPGGSAGEKMEAFLNEQMPARILHILPHVEDRAGMKCRGMSIEVRTARRDWVLENDVMFGPRGFQRKDADWFEPGWSLLPEVPILHQPIAALYLEAGDPAGALRLNPPNSVPGTALDTRIFILARAEQERREALEAFKVLYKHYSLHEELWRLNEWMKLLPYDLDESAEMEEYRRLLNVQVGHLQLNGSGPRDWYAGDFAGGSPSEVADANYVSLFKKPNFDMPLRFQWLVQECRRLGFKRVVEFGSVDGISLFPLIQKAPDIEWHGVEVSRAAVAHGRKVAAEVGMEKDFHLHPANSFADFSATRDARELGPFDAAVVFEVLEHNTPTQGQEILLAAEAAVRPGGCIFISTPCGNWSAHDEKTRVFELKKDHIFSFTHKRMCAFLKDKKDVFVEVVENNNIAEGNANVHARYQR